MVVNKTPTREEFYREELTNLFPSGTRYNTLSAIGHLLGRDDYERAYGEKLPKEDIRFMHEYHMPEESLYDDIYYSANWIRKIRKPEYKQNIKIAIKEIVRVLLSKISYQAARQMSRNYDSEVILKGNNYRQRKELLLQYFEVVSSTED